MKHTLKSVLLFMTGISMITLIGCGEESKESCDRPDDNVGSCAATDITACCDDSGSCYYLYKDKRYENETQLATVCASPSTQSVRDLEIQLDAFTAKLIEEARVAAVCD